LFLDVSGDGFLTPIDPLLIINYLNARLRPSGEGEGEGSAPPPAAGLAPATSSTAAASAVTSSGPVSAAGNVPTIPPVLLAAPNVVFELRPTSGAAATTPPSPPASSTDPSDPLLASPELLTAVLPPSWSDGLDKWGSKKSQETSEDWEDLLDALAADQVGGA
jgi:hypothetical protein